MPSASTVRARARPIPELPPMIIALVMTRASNASRGTRKAERHLDVTRPPRNRPTGGTLEGMNAMAEFLRIRRGRIGLADVGLPSGPGARRTPGLRREELAVL